jgi:spore maturation protein CgeB
MKIIYFTHSLVSCWNHGNSHFVRGVMRELILAGQDVRIFEPFQSWSLQNLMKDQGAAGVEPFRRAYPELSSHEFSTLHDIEAEIEHAHLLIVHEWNEPWLVAAIGDLRRKGAPFLLLFHDTHHRAVSDPDAIFAFDLDGYDGVLTFGEALAEVYRRWGWGNRVFVWHEAADIRHFRPPLEATMREGLVWIGNWGDGERSTELEEFLLRPAATVGLPLDIYGVRYPPEALAALTGYGAVYRGWVANARVPEVFARHLATVHVPRRYYASVLPGIPTIRIFEALACGIPLISAPWDDSERLFLPGADYLIARNATDMARHLAALRDDADLRSALAKSGHATIRARHTCAHRAQELVTIATHLARAQ